jgi:hypothetical protein
VQFLSDEWRTALDQAAMSLGGLAELGEEPFVLQQTITGGPDGDISYRIEINATGARVVSGPAVDPTVSCRQDYQTAVAITTGQSSAQAAFMVGDLVIGGNLAALIERADALRNLDDIFADVRAQTTY